MRHIRNRDPEAIAYARFLRREMGKAGRKLWKLISNRKAGFRFRKQVAVGNYFLDFYCPELGLCIELDGMSHEDRGERDKKRDSWLLENGIETIRISTSELGRSPEAVQRGVIFNCLRKAGRVDEFEW